MWTKTRSTTRALPERSIAAWIPSSSREAIGTEQLLDDVGELGEPEVVPSHLGDVGLEVGDPLLEPVDGCPAGSRPQGTQLHVTTPPPL